MRIVDQNKVIKRNFKELEKRLGRGKIFDYWYNQKG